MTEPARHTMSLEEFFDWDDGTDIRYELLSGVVTAMARSHQIHGRISANVIVALSSRLTSPCQALAEAGVIIPHREESFYIADIAVTCEEASPSKRYIENPILLVEILSPATATHDRGHKLQDYIRLSSIEGVALVESGDRRVQVWLRDGERWIVQDHIGDASVVLPRCDTAIPLSEIYRNIRFVQS